MFLRKMLLTIITFLTGDDQHKGVQRVASFIILGIALLMSSVLFGYALVRPVGDTKTCLTIIELLLLSGVGLMLGQFIERAAIKRKLGITDAK
jgi:hypothetical protein